jgi:hypothetical protein
MKTAFSTLPPLYIPAEKVPFSENASSSSLLLSPLYFDVCATDLSCLVSLPVEGGGLYHIVAEVFFTLEDSTQVVYFYGNQSIVSTESRVVSNNQSFYDVVPENIGIVAAALAGAVVIGSGNGDNNKDDDDAFSLNGTFSAGMYKGGACCLLK